MLVTADRMLKRYTRLSASPTENEFSTGLGLSIVKRLVDQNGGEIELISEEGESATSWFPFHLMRIWAIELQRQNLVLRLESVQRLLEGGKTLDRQRTSDYAMTPPNDLRRLPRAGP